MEEKIPSQNQAAPETTEGKFQAWVNNRMAMILMYVEHHRDRPQIKLAQIDFFLDSIAHHFVDCHSPQPVWSAFRYLRCYFQNYPAARSHHDQKAIEMVARIYQALNIEFSYYRKTNHDYSMSESVQRGIRND